MKWPAQHLPSMRIHAVGSIMVLVSVIGVPVVEAETRSPKAERDAVAEAASDGIIGHAASVTAGWAMGLAYDAFGPPNPPGGDEQDLSPFLNIVANLGEGSQWSVEARVILANFGRLLMKESVPGAEAQVVPTVRRAIFAETTIRTPVSPVWKKKGGVLLNVLNAGFSLDAEQQPDEGDVLDAASYWFVGPTVLGQFDGARMAADLLVGTSEMLTGVEAFDFKKDKRYPLRLRPRFWIRLKGGLGAGRALDIGFWGDLGFSKRYPDAITVFVGTPLFPVEPTTQQ